MNAKFESLLRRHSLLMAALSALLMALAAPYLVPENPDSAVFRSGSLGAILLIVSVFPVRASLKRCSLRALAYGGVFALIFSLCLGLGSELAVYDGLLPGMGSLLRRLAVPVMAMPFLGALFAFLFDLRPSPSPAKPAGKPIPGWCFFLLFALCYGAVLLALFPGVISYDFEHEISQYTTGVYDPAHPVFHTLFLGTLFALGEALFGSMTGGAALYNTVQLLLLAGMYAYACAFVQQRTARRAQALVLAACFALLPFHGVLAVSTAKDPLFTGLCVLLCLELWHLCEDACGFIASRASCVRMALICLFMSLLRHNAPFAVLPTCIALPVLCRGRRRQGAVLAAVCLALSLGAPRLTEAMVSAQRTPNSETMSVPCQQLMRTAERAGVSEEEYAELNGWFSEQTYRYRAHCADPAKGGNFAFDRYQEDPGAFWSMWARYGLAYPRVYLEAFLENCAGIWNPDDISHAHNLSSEEYDFIYLNTMYPFAADRYPITPQCYLRPVQKVLYAFMHASVHEKYPALSKLFLPATYTFMLLFCFLYLRRHKIRRYGMSLLPPLGIFLSVLFSAGVFVRYVYPLMACMPVLLILILFGRRDETAP